jgi:hypothetical protein
MDIRERLNSDYYYKNPGLFEKDMEEEFPSMKTMSDKVKNRIHYMCWDRGHSSGYHEVYGHYFDLIDLYELITEVGVV